MKNNCIYRTGLESIVKTHMIFFCFHGKSVIVYNFISSMKYRCNEYDALGMRRVVSIRSLASNTLAFVHFRSLKLLIPGVMPGCVISLWFREFPKVALV